MTVHRGLTICFLLVVVSAGWVWAFPEASVFFVASVLTHVVLGVFLIQRRNPVYRARPLLIGKVNTFAQLSLAAAALAHAAGVIDLGVPVAALIVAVTVTTILSAAGYAGQGLRALDPERAS